MRAMIVSEGKHEREGALETLVLRLRGSEFASHEHRRMCDKSIHTHPGKGDRLFKRAVSWLEEAKRQKFDVLVLLIDEDGYHARISHVDKAQVYDRESLPRALGVAVRTFDAWMLADEMAVSTATGQNVQRRPDPETIRDPKRMCADLLRDGTKRQTQTQMYAAIAREARLETLVERCRQGFAPFASRIRALPTKS